MKRHLQPVPIFFATDERYLPYLAVTLRSLADFADPSREYIVTVLTDGLSAAAEQKLRSMELGAGIRLSLFDPTDRLARIRGKLKLRDYYSESIYYRLFIPTLFPMYRRAVYLDCDVILRDDIGRFFDTDIGDALVGAVTDEAVRYQPIFRRYVSAHLGIPSESYFNSGVLLMNLEAMRLCHFEEQVIDLIANRTTSTVAPDQDCLNLLCYGKRYFFGTEWNKQPTADPNAATSSPKLVHFNMFQKPWRYANVPLQELFWSCAERTPFYREIRHGFDAYSDFDRLQDQLSAKKLLENAEELAHGSPLVPFAESEDMAFERAEVHA